MKSLFTTLFITVIVFTAQTPAQSSIEELTASINGTIMNSGINQSSLASSENGKYWCTYEIDEVTDEMRRLSNLKVYENDHLILTMDKIPGSDVSVTNSGRLIFYDHSEHFKGILKLYVYSKESVFLFSKTFTDAWQFEYSSSGETMGVRTPEGITVLKLSSGNSYKIDKGLQFAFSEDDLFETVAPPNRILVYKNSSLFKTISTNLELPRKVLISAKNNLTAVIDKYNLKVYSLDTGEQLFADKIGGNLAFRDLKIINGKIITGIHRRTKEESAGILRVYDLNGNRTAEKSGKSRKLQVFNYSDIKKKNTSDYDPVPWPFFPFDSMRTVWNHYEQHMGLGGADSYLHQGLDLITPIAEPTYSVIDGYVKLVLTLGGSSYWRTAISDTQTAGRSNGWLSAHLIESTIQFDIGDTVNIHDYLGDIIQWSGDWGHIHFVNISDSGTVWYYSDDEWGINFNPILALEPYPDTIPPYIDDVFTWSKFAFAVNESSTYLQPDSLYGEIDIIAKVVDYAGDSEWQQPAYTTWYTIKRISDGEIIKPRTLGHILNHKYPFYESSWFMDYAGVMFQRDYTLLPSSWMDTERNYYHNLTNSNGDSLLDLSEKSLAFNTEDYPDGDYRIIIEAYDESGNSDIDSMDVQFKNGNFVGVKSLQAGSPHVYSLGQNYPNPFNPATRIRYTIIKGQFVTIKVYDVLGNEVATLVNEYKPAGRYNVEFIMNNEQLSSGVYLYRLQAGSYTAVKKMIYMK